MKVLLTFIPPQSNNHEFKWANIQPPAAIYLLGTILKHNDIDVVIIDPSFYINKNILGGTNKISEDLLKDVDIVCLSSNSFNWGTTKIFIGFIKSVNLDIRIVLGGVHPSALDEYVLNTTPADVVIRGEGEKRLLEIINSLRSHGKSKLDEIPGITYKKDSGELVRTKDALVLSIEEFNNVIFPKYDEMPINTYRTLPFESSRGCLFNCSFCGVPYHRSWRPLSLENAVKKFNSTLEISKEKLRVPTIVFGDDCFTVDKERVQGIFKHINSLTGEFYIAMEGRLSDLEDTSIMDDLPVDRVMQFIVGIENGYDEGLRKSRKGYNVKKIGELFRNYNNKPQVLEKIYCSFIIGLPWEMVDDCIKTVQFAAYLYEEFGVKCNITWWCIIPSELWDRRREFNIHLDESIYDDPIWYETKVITESDKKNFFRSHPNLSIQDREKIDNLIDFYFNRGIKLVDSW